MTTKNLILTVPALAITSMVAAQSAGFMKSVNGKAPVKCARTIEINASPERVWSVLININDWPRWQSDISKSSMDGTAEVGSTFVWKSGGATIHSAIHTVKEGEVIGWTGKSLGMLAIHNWVLIQHGDKTIVEVEESMEGLLSGLLRRMLNKNLEKGMVNWLFLLKKESER